MSSALSYSYLFREPLGISTTTLMASGASSPSADRAGDDQLEIGRNKATKRIR